MLTLRCWYRMGINEIWDRAHKGTQFVRKGDLRSAFISSDPSANVRKLANKAQGFMKFWSACFPGAGDGRTFGSFRNSFRNSLRSSFRGGGDNNDGVGSGKFGGNSADDASKPVTLPDVFDGADSHPHKALAFSLKDVQRIVQKEVESAVAKVIARQLLHRVYHNA